MRQARRAANREAYLDRWGPDLFRRALLDTLEGRGGSWSEVPFRVGDHRDQRRRRPALWRLVHGPRTRRRAGGLGLVDRLPRTTGRPLVRSPTTRSRRSSSSSTTSTCGASHATSSRSPGSATGRSAGSDGPGSTTTTSSSGQASRSSRWCAPAARRSPKLLPIATNPARFRPVEPDPELACDVLFVGNYWGEPRSVVDALPALAAVGLDVHVHGRGWDRLPEFDDLAHGPLDYDDVPRAYASARFVVDDAAAPTAPYGSVNSRVFDALASGARRGKRRRTRRTRPFRRALPDLDRRPRPRREPSRPGLGDPAGTNRLARRAAPDGPRAAHLSPASGDDPRRARRAGPPPTRFGIRIGVPSWEVAESWGDYHFARAVQRALERARPPHSGPLPARLVVGRGSRATR